MKSLKFSLAVLCLSGCLIVGTTTESHAQFGKLKEKLAGGGGSGEKKEGKLADPYAENFEDPSGTSGAYNLLVGTEVPQGLGKRLQKTYKIKFIEKENGDFVNKLEVYVTKDGQKVGFRLDEKMTKKMGARVFRTTDTHSIWLVEVEKGMFLEMLHPQSHTYELDGSEKAEDVYAKDAAKLEGWDKDVAKAKFDAMFKAGAKKDVAKLRERLMEYKAYKENVGKVVFVSNYGVFNYSYTDKPTEDPKDFIKSQSMGKSLYWGAYLDMPMTVSCGKDCERNMVYEMNGIKADRVALRNSGQKWSQNIKKKEAEDRFCLNNGFQLWSPGENIMDYAFIKVLYENKDKFKKGQTYKLTATMYSNRDGNNVEKVAEGSINLIWDDEAIQVMEGKVFKDFREFLDE
jgi:hypothetical protein